jgi:sec-independent protein translocase protein TatC
VKPEPELFDLPMSLGDHLHELRRRLIFPIVSLAVLFLVAFIFERQLKLVVAMPMKWALEIDPIVTQKAGLDPKTFKFQTIDVMESMMASMSVCFYAAIFVAFPIFIYQLWMFISVGLMPKERRLAFLFIPVGIMFFYAGTMAGFFEGLPFYYYVMIKWNAGDPISDQHTGLASYLSNFVLMTLTFGFIADIPWLIMVLVRVGFVTVDQLGKNRKIAIMVNAVIAAFAAPPDWFSMVVMMIPLVGLFELGLLLSRLMMWHHRRMTVKEEAAELKRMADEELAAHRAHVPTDEHASELTSVHDDGTQPVPRGENRAMTDGTSDTAASPDHVIDHNEGSMGDTSGDTSNDDPTAPRKDDDRG